VVDLANRIAEYSPDAAADRLNGETVSPPSPSGRDAHGRFAPGNPGGPGRPPKARELRYLAAVVESVGLQRFHFIIERQAERAEQGNLAAAQFLARLILGASPPLLSEVPEEQLPDPEAEVYVPPGPTLDELAHRAKVEALISMMRGEDLDDDLPDPPLGGDSA
jgi:hypothetical protein